MIVLRRASVFNHRTFAFLKGTTHNHQAFLEYSLYRSTRGFCFTLLSSALLLTSLGTYIRPFASSRRVANKSRNDSGDPNRDHKTYMESRDGSFAGPFDTRNEALLKLMGFKDWTVRTVPLENGIEAVVAGGRVTCYLHPNHKSDPVDKRLVDDFGVWSIDELSDCELADYLADSDSP